MRRVPLRSSAGLGDVLDGAAAWAGDPGRATAAFGAHVAEAYDEGGRGLVVNQLSPVCPLLRTDPEVWASRNQGMWRSRRGRSRTRERIDFGETIVMWIS